MKPTLRGVLPRLSAVLLTALLPTLPAQAAERTYTVATDHGALTLFPELKSAPAPAWVKPGTRITFYNAAATIPSSYQMPPVLDPNGDMVDPKTGKSVRVDGNVSASGHGVTQLDVIALLPDAVVCRTNTYVINGANGPFSLATSAGFTTVPGAAYDWWLNPSVMKKALASLAGSGVKVLPGPYQAAGKKFDAQWISTSGQGASTTYVFDPADGLILHSAICTATAGRTSLINNIPTNTGGSMSLARNTFAAMRTITPPWAGAKLPPAAAKLQNLLYEGAQVTTLGVSVTWPVRVAVKVTGRGENFLQIRKTTWIDHRNGMRPQPAEVDAVTGTGEFLPLAIPPEFLTKFQMGQELDKDPITRIGVGYSGTVRGPQGRPLAVLTETAGGNTTRTDFAYDLESGLLTGFTITDPASRSQTTMTLRSAE